MWRIPLPNSVSGFAVGTGTLTAVANSPVSLGYSPMAMAVTTNNKFLYVAAPGNINVYTINSDGSLTGASGGTGVAIANIVSMDVSPDGQWLIALEGTSLLAQIDVFQINASTGALASLQPTDVSDSECRDCAEDGAHLAEWGAGLRRAGHRAATWSSTSIPRRVRWSSAEHLAVTAQTSDNGLAVDSATGVSLHCAKRNRRRSAGVQDRDGRRAE